MSVNHTKTVERAYVGRDKLTRVFPAWRAHQALPDGRAFDRRRRRRRARRPRRSSVMSGAGLYATSRRGALSLSDIEGARQ